MIWREEESTRAVWPRLLGDAARRLIEAAGPDEEIESVLHLDRSRLRARGVSAIIFDVDNTLGPWGFSQLDPDVALWLGDLRSDGFRLGFVSNDHGLHREHLARSLDGLPIIWRAGKPRLGAFHRMLRTVGVSPRETAMVGDRLFTDVWGARRAGLYTVLVRPIIAADEGPWLGLQRLLERSTVEVHRWMRMRALTERSRRGEETTLLDTAE